MAYSLQRCEDTASAACGYTLKVEGYGSLKLLLRIQGRYIKTTLSKAAQVPALQYLHSVVFGGGGRYRSPTRRHRLCYADRALGGKVVFPPNGPVSSRSGYRLPHAEVTK